MSRNFEVGDLVEWLESIYPKVHRMNRGIIIRSNGAAGEMKLYKVVTTEKESMWVYEADLRKLEDE